MSGQTELAQRFECLSEIREIMTAMKTLALIETRKLVRFIDHQRRMQANIEDAAADFATYFPIRYAAEEHSAVVIAVGSERGFCGNFNENISQILENGLSGMGSDMQLVVVGNRLGMKLEAAPSVITGATVVEDIPGVIDRLMDSLQGASVLYALVHDAEKEAVFLKPILPFDLPESPEKTSEPLLQLAPDDFLSQMLDQYLLAKLYGLLYESLLVENRHRLGHMEQAIERLDKTLSDLSLKRNALRQEKITEEIEVILAREYWSK